MAAGELLVIECTDPLTTIDIPNLIRETGDTHRGSGKKGRVLTFRIRKGLTAGSHSFEQPTRSSTGFQTAISSIDEFAELLDAHRIGDQAVAAQPLPAPPAAARARLISALTFLAMSFGRFAGPDSENHSVADHVDSPAP